QLSYLNRHNDLTCSVPATATSFLQFQALAIVNCLACLSKNCRCWLASTKSQSTLRCKKKSSD
ncbi:hypothetical protein C8R45DRAFT_1220087, partial [Mycena sanguinolenta]